MNQNKLDCCIVRDLLPSYIEELTEPETSRQVAAHLEGCADCRAREKQMRTQLPMQPVSKKSLRFLKRARNNRILSALAVVLIAALVVAAWYCYLFPYANTEQGRLAAVQDFVTGGDIVSADTADTPIQVVSYAETDSRLFVSFAAEDERHSYGFLELQRGVNGSYRPVYASYYTGTDSAPCLHWFNFQETDLTAFGAQDASATCWVFAGFQCEDVAAVRVSYTYDTAADRTVQYEKTYPVTERTFLWTRSEEQIAAELGISDFDTESSYISIADDPVLLDQNGNEITQQNRSADWQHIEDSLDLRYIYILMFGMFVLGIRAAMYIWEIR